MRVGPRVPPCQPTVPPVQARIAVRLTTAERICTCHAADHIRMLDASLLRLVHLLAWWRAAELRGDSCGPLLAARWLRERQAATSGWARARTPVRQISLRGFRSLAVHGGQHARG